MLQAKLEMEPSANGPIATVGATPMSKYGQKLKSSRKVVRTSFLNQNDRYWIINNFSIWKFYHKILPKLDNWQFVLISRKFNFKHERPRKFSFSLDYNHIKWAWAWPIKLLLANFEF